MNIKKIIIYKFSISKWSIIEWCEPLKKPHNSYGQCFTPKIQSEIEFGNKKCASKDLSLNEN
jgi:hypothetical protein